jgi:hypothetical protein
MEAYVHCRDLIQEHIVNAEDLILDESAPDDRVVLQAEVMNSRCFLDMRYALHSGMGMRPAYEIMQHTNGIRAVEILKTYLDASSWDNLCWILQEYSDCVVELSSYDCAVGVLGWSTIFWEVRAY